MDSINVYAKKMTANWAGSLIGAGAGWYFGKSHVSNKFALVGVVIVSAVVGAVIQSKISALSSLPTATTVKK